MKLKTDNEKESLQQFYDRSYFALANGYEGTVFVWQSAYHKKTDNTRSEKWSVETAKNYINWLKKNQ